MGKHKRRNAKSRVRHGATPTTAPSRPPPVVAGRRRRLHDYLREQPGRLLTVALFAVSLLASPLIALWLARRDERRVAPAVSAELFPPDDLEDDPTIKGIAVGGVVANNQVSPILVTKFGLRSQGVTYPVEFASANNCDEAPVTLPVAVPIAFYFYIGASGDALAGLNEDWTLILHTSDGRSIEARQTLPPAENQASQLDLIQIGFDCPAFPD